MNLSTPDYEQTWRENQRWTNTVPAPITRSATRFAQPGPVGVQRNWPRSDAVDEKYKFLRLDTRLSCSILDMAAAHRCSEVIAALGCVLLGSQPCTDANHMVHRTAAWGNSSMTTGKSARFGVLHSLSRSQ